MLNKVELEGKIDKPVSHLQTKKNFSLCKIFLKIESTYPGKSFVKVSYVPVTAWGQLADSCKQFKEGDYIKINGTLEFQTWETTEGKKGSALTVKASGIEKVNFNQHEIETEDLF